MVRQFWGGLVCGILLGVLVIAPNERLNQSVRNLWYSTFDSVAALFDTATETATEVARQ